MSGIHTDRGSTQIYRAVYAKDNDNFFIISHFHLRLDLIGLNRHVRQRIFLSNVKPAQLLSRLFGTRIIPKLYIAIVIYIDTKVLARYFGILISLSNRTKNCSFLLSIIYPILGLVGRVLSYHIATNNIGFRIDISILYFY